jgi:hypothetical protein
MRAAHRGSSRGGHICTHVVLGVCIVGAVLLPMRWQHPQQQATVEVVSASH